MSQARSSLVLLLAATACTADDTLPADDDTVDAQVDAQVDAPPGAPETTITAQPPSLTNQRTARFTFTSSVAGSTFKCALDGDAATPCSSPFERDLPDASHTFEVWATSPQGATDPTAARHVWRLDTQPPATTFVVTPAAVDNSLDARFQFSSEPAARFECALDGARFEPCSSPHATAMLAEGAHAFEVRAIDEAGNVEAPPRRHAWTLDRTDPDTVIDSGPATATNATSAVFTFSSPDAGAAATFTCSYNHGGWLPCASPWTLTGLSDGLKSLGVRVHDAAGNLDPSPATRVWRVDTTPPTVRILATPNQSIGDATPSFPFEAFDATPLVIECRITGSGATDFAPCTSPYTATTIPDGDATFVVRVRDEVGLEAIAELPFSVDAQVDAPETAITAQPPSLTNQRTARFTFTSSIAGSTFACALDGNAATPCSSPFEHDLPDGSHTFEVWATSPQGATDPTAARHVWRLDTQPPATTFVVAPAAVDNSLDARFQFSSEPAARFDCALDGAPFAPCSSPYATATLAEGAHAFEVRAIDEAGNVEAPPRRHAWTLDRTEPNTVIDSGPPTATNATSAVFTFSSPDAGAAATFTCSYNYGAWLPCTSPWTLTGLSDGLKSLGVRVHDAAGNLDSSPATRLWRVDTTPPTVRILATPNQSIGDATPRFWFEAFDGRPGSLVIDCRITGSGATDFAPCTSPYTATAIPDGDATFVVRVRDEVGLETTAELPFSVDTVAPVVTITSAPSPVVTTPVVTVSFTVDGPATTRCRVDGTVIACNDGSFQSPALDEGAHAWVVVSYDRAGNDTDVRRTFRVDTEAPTVAITEGPSGVTADATPTFTFETSDTATAVTTTCQIDQLAPVPCTSPFTAAAVGHGAHTLTVIATDQGAHSASATRTFSVDTTPLTVTITSGPTGVVTTRKPTVHFATTGVVDYVSCRVDGGPPTGASCSGSANSVWPNAFLADGVHTMTITVFDDAGATAIATTEPFTIDATAPVVTFTGGPSELQHYPHQTATIEFTVTGDPVAIECRSGWGPYPSGPYQPCTSPQTVTVPRPNQQFALEVRTRDVHGNEKSYTRGWFWVP